VLALEWRTTALRAMLIGTLMTLALLFLLFPALVVRPRRPPARKVWS